MQKIIIALSIVCMIGLTAKAQNVKYDYTIDIVKHRIELPNHNPHDLYVMDLDRSYRIEYYLKHGSQILPHRASVGSGKIFDKADYSWVSKKKADVRLYNSSTGEEVKLKVFADRRMNGMELNSEDLSQN